MTNSTWHLIAHCTHYSAFRKKIFTFFFTSFKPDHAILNQNTQFVFAIYICLISFHMLAFLIKYLVTPEAFLQTVEAAGKKKRKRVVR